VHDADLGPVTAQGRDQLALAHRVDHHDVVEVERNDLRELRRDDSGGVVG